MAHIALHREQSPGEQKYTCVKLHYNRDDRVNFSSHGAGIKLGVANVSQTSVQLRIPCTTPPVLQQRIQNGIGYFTLILWTLCRKFTAAASI